MGQFKKKFKILKEGLGIDYNSLDNALFEQNLLMTRLREENKTLKEENRLLKNEIAWLKDHTKYNSITEEYYIDGTMTATEAKLRLQQAESNLNYISKLEEENKNLKESLDIATKCSSKEEDGIIRLSEENKKLSEKNGQLKKELAFKNTMLDNVKAEYECLQDVIRKIKKRVKEHTTYSVKAEFINKFG